jgi:hypothetical protein
MITVRAIAGRPATTFGAGALIHDGRKALVRPKGGQPAPEQPAVQAPVGENLYPVGLIALLGLLLAVG